MTTREQLWDSTAAAHSQIQTGHFAIYDIADSIIYLHPDMAAHLLKIANSIESARQTIQGNAAEMINRDIRERETCFHNTIVAALAKVSS